MKKVKPPKQIAAEKIKMGKYSLYLEVKLMDRIKKESGAVGLFPSEVVNQAIKDYLAGLDSDDDKKR